VTDVPDEWLSPFQGDRTRLTGRLAFLFFSFLSATFSRAPAHVPFHCCHDSVVAKIKSQQKMRTFNEHLDVHLPP
ncbi:MAG: hypothetical protein V1255_02850, partial [Alphaproteobacteria bacterium]|nr:hypothetical protein [Alphaproteobacteria bacterium]